VPDEHCPDILICYVADKFNETTKVAKFGDNLILRVLFFKDYKPQQEHFYSNIYPTRCNVTPFILSGNSSICFGWFLHPSSGA
jgi:hypothetical protein